MPPAGKTDRPDPNTSRIRAKRTKNTRLPLGEIQAVNQREVEVEDDDDEDNADATGDGVAPDKEAALVAAAVAGLFEEDARAGVVHDENVAPDGSVNANSDVNAGAVNTDAAAAQDEVQAEPEVEKEEEVKFTPDDNLSIADHWAIKLLQKPGSKASTKVKKEWADALVHDSLFDESLNCRFSVGSDEWYGMKTYKHIISKTPNLCAGSRSYIYRFWGPLQDRRLCHYSSIPPAFKGCHQDRTRRREGVGLGPT